MTKKIRSDNLKRKKLERKLEIEINQDKMDNMDYASNEEATFYKKQIYRGF